MSSHDDDGPRAPTRPERLHCILQVFFPAKLGHGASSLSLASFGHRAGPGRVSQLGIELTDEEIDKITAFLGSLSGKQPEVTYPILPPSVATTPHPQP